MSVIYIAAQRLGSTLRLPLANLSDMDKPVGDYGIDGIERIVLKSKSDKTTFVPVDRDIERENAKLRELCREIYEDQCDECDQWKYRDRLRELGVEL